MKKRWKGYCILDQPMQHAVIVNTAHCPARQDYKDKFLMDILDFYLSIFKSVQI